MELYEKVVGDDGTETYQKVESLDPIVKESPLYKEVLAETIQRRQELKALKGKTNEKSDTEKAAEVPTREAETPQPALDVESLKEELVAKLLKTLQEKQAEETGRERQLKELISKYKLSEQDLPFISTATDPEAAAKFLSTRLAGYAPSLGENRAAIPTGDNEKEFKDRIRQRMFTR